MGSGSEPDGPGSDLGRALASGDGDLTFAEVATGESNRENNDVECLANAQITWESQPNGNLTAFATQPMTHLVGLVGRHLDAGDMSLAAKHSPLRSWRDTLPLLVRQAEAAHAVHLTRRLAVRTPTRRLSFWHSSIAHESLYL